MSFQLTGFSVGVFYNNRPFTPREVQDFISSKDYERFIVSDELQDLAQKHLTELSNIVRKHGLSVETELQAKTSTAGKELAHLSMQHGNCLTSQIVDLTVRQTFF